MERTAERVQRPFQTAFQRHAEPVLGLGEPFRGIGGLVQERVRGGQDRIARAQVPEAVQGLQETPVAVGRVHPVRRQHVQYRLRGIPDILHIRFAESGASFLDLLQMVLGIRGVLVDAVAPDRFRVVRGLEVHGHLLERRLQAEAVAVLQAGLHVLREPAEEAPVVLRETVQDAVHALLHQGGLVQFHLVRGELPDLAGEGPQRLLEELVDGGHRKGGIVMQDAAQLPGRAFLQGLRRRKDRRDEVPEVRRAGRIRGEGEQLVQDAAFHLVGGLVREGHGEDVAVGLRVLLRQEQADIFAGQVVGLPRTSRSFHDGDHRPQIILKSQYSQVLRSSVRRKGTDGSVISAKRSWRRSRVRRANSAFAGRSSSGSVNRRETE